MKTLLQISLLIAIPTILFGQNNQTEFQKCWENNDTTCQTKILMKWEKANPNDPELFTAYFKYHFMKARREVLALSKEDANGAGLELRDDTDQAAGFLGSQTHYDLLEFKKGIDKINEGINKYPNRLDMRFGKIYALGEIEDWENFTREIITAVRYSSKNKNQWTWMNNEEQGKDFFLSSIQSYQIQLFDTEDDSLLLNMRKIASTILEYYPEHIESLSNLSITHLLLGEIDEGLKPLLKAEKINPEDHVILTNIAHGYVLKGNKDKAIEYYEKIIKIGNEQVSAFAQQQIKELKK